MLLPVSAAPALARHPDLRRVTALEPGDHAGDGWLDLATTAAHLRFDQVVLLVPPAGAAATPWATALGPSLDTLDRESGDQVLIFAAIPPPTGHALSAWSWLSDLPDGAGALHAALVRRAERLQGAAPALADATRRTLASDGLPTPPTAFALHLGFAPDGDGRDAWTVEGVAVALPETLSPADFVELARRWRRVAASGEVGPGDGVAFARATNRLLDPDLHRIRWSLRAMAQPVDAVRAWLSRVGLQ